MKMSKSVFFAFVVAVVSVLALSIQAGANAPSISVSGNPVSVAAGQSFAITVIASEPIFPTHFVNSVQIIGSNAAWTISPQTAVACGFAVNSCSATFTITAPSSVASGVVSFSTFTAFATTSASESSSSQFSVTAIGPGVTTTAATTSLGAVVPIKNLSVSVEVDGSSLREGDTSTIRQLERGETFEVKVSLEAERAVKDVQINAFVTGFDSRTEQISDSVRPFDLGENESVVKRLSLKLPDRAAEDKYKLRVVISDRFSEPIVKNYNIKIQPAESKIAIRDFEISPEGEVQAGRAVLATVRVKNLGDSKESDVKIKVSIPELGVSATSDFIDDLDAEETATSEEFFLRVGSCTRPGVYDVVAEVTFDDGDERVTSKKPLSVTRGECDAVSADSGQKKVSGKITIASPEPQSAVAGGSAASYPITITNGGESAKAFVLSVDGAEWADFKVSPGNLVTVNAGSTQTAYVLASVRAGTQAGERVFTVSVKDTADNVLETLALKANVVQAGGGTPSLRNALAIALVVIVAILVLVGLILAFRRVRGGEEGESQTYY